MGFERKADSNMNLIRWWDARWVTPLAMNMIFCGFFPWIEKVETDFCLLSRSKRVRPHRDSDYLA